MTFWEHFLRLLPHKPTHALAALYWRVTRRRVRAINRLRVASADLPFAYDVWIDRIESNRNAVAAISAATDEWASRPRFPGLLYALYSIQSGATSAIDAVARAPKHIPSGRWFVKPTDLVEARLIASDSEYVVPLQVGDSLLWKQACFGSQRSLNRIRVLLSSMGIKTSWTDTGGVRGHGSSHAGTRSCFWRKDDLSGAVAIEINLARSAGRKARGVDEVLLAATSQAKGPIVHVPHILCHVSSQDDRPERLITVERHLEPTGAICTAGPFGTVKVNWPLPVSDDSLLSQPRRKRMSICSTPGRKRPCAH